MKIFYKKWLCLGFAVFLAPLLRVNAEHNVFLYQPDAFLDPISSARSVEFIVEVEPESGAEIESIHLYVNPIEVAQENREGYFHYLHDPVAQFVRIGATDEWKCVVDNIPLGEFNFGARSVDNTGAVSWYDVDLITSPIDVKINFSGQGDLDLPEEYEADIGKPFGYHGKTLGLPSGIGSFQFGWNADLSDEGLGFRTPASTSVDVVAKTGIAMGDDTGYMYTWELAVPEGAYEISLTVGDPSHLGAHKFIIEDSVMVTSTTTSLVPQLTINEVVYVEDGRLTIQEIGGEVIARLVSIECRGISAAEKIGKTYVRGAMEPYAGSYYGRDNFHAFVKPLSYQTGLRHVGDLGDNQVLQYDRDSNLGTVLQGDPEYSYVIPADSPIASFGKPFGGSSMFVGEDYSFAFGAGKLRNDVTVTGGGSTGGIFIEVIDAATGDVLPAERIDIEVPDPTDPSMITIIAPAHGLSANDLVQVANTGGELPSGLVAGTDYYALVIDLDTFRLSESLGGDPVLITDAGSGTHTLNSVQNFSVESAWSAETSNQHNYTITSSSNAGLLTRLQILPTGRNWASVYPNYILNHSGERSDRVYRVYAWGYFADDYNDLSTANFYPLCRDFGQQSTYHSNGEAPVLLYEFSFTDPNVMSVDLLKPHFSGQAVPPAYAAEETPDDAQTDFAQSLDPLFVDPNDNGEFIGDVQWTTYSNGYRFYVSYPGHGLSELDRVRVLRSVVYGAIGNSKHSVPYDVLYAKDVDANGFYLARKNADGEIVHAYWESGSPFRFSLSSGDNVFHKIADVDESNPAFLSLGSSPELRSHPYLDDFAAENPDPLFLANFVHNEIDLIDPIHYNEDNLYYESIDEGGLRRNAYTTLVERQGSPKEQCALLVYMLRKAGVPAVYMFPQRDTLKVKRGDIGNILGINLEQTYGVPEQVSVNYPWVMAWIEDESRWVHLFPWYKNHELIEGFDLYSKVPAASAITADFAKKYLTADASVMNLSPFSDQVPEIWPKYIQNLLSSHSGLSLSDVGVQFRNRPIYRYDWNDFPAPVLGFSHIFFKTSQDYTLSGRNPEVVTRLVDRHDLNTFEEKEFDLVEVVFREYDSEGNATSNEITTGAIPVCDLTGRNLFWFWDAEDTGVAIEGSSLNVGLSGRTSDDLQNLLSSFPASGNANLFDCMDPLQRDDLEKPVLASISGLDPSLTWAVFVQEYRNLNFSGTGYSNPGFIKSLWGSVLDEKATKGIVGPRILKQDTRGSIGLFDGKVNTAQVETAHELYNVFQAIVDSVANPEMTDEYKFLYGALTYRQALAFHKSQTDFAKWLQGIFKVRLLSSSSTMLSFMQHTDAGDRPIFDVFSSANTYALAGQSTPGKELVSSQSLHRDLGLLDALHGSAAEHGVLNEFFGQDSAMSTVKTLQIASTDSYYVNEYGGFTELTAFDYKNEGEKPYYDYYAQADRSLRDYFENFNSWDSHVNAYFAETNADKDYNFIFATPGHVYHLDADDPFPVPPGPSDPDEGRPFFAYFLVDWLNGAYGSLIGQDSLNGYLHHGGYGDFIENLSNFKEQLSAWAEGDTESTAEAGDQHEAERGSEPSDNSEPLNNQIGPEHVDSDTHIADPVNVVTGDFYIDEVDLVLPGPFSLPIRRNYSSQNLYPGKFGWGWKMGLEDHLDIFPDESVIRAAEMDGTVINYSKVSANRWKVEEANNSLLSNNRSAGIGGLRNKFRAYIERETEGADTVYYLYGADGSTRRFVTRTFYQVRDVDAGTPIRDTAILDYWEDNRGNRLTFTYRDDVSENERRDFGLLHKITSSNGNYLEFEYTASRRIRSIHTNDSRYIRYEYDRYGDLREVHLPDGAQIDYEYKITDKAYTDPLITVEPYSTHLMTRIVKPEGRILENDYDSERRVVEQRATVGDDMVPVRNATYVYSGDTSSGWTRVYDVFSQPSQTPVTDTNCTLYEYSAGLITRIVDKIGQEIHKGYYTTAGTYPNPNGSYNEVTKTLPLITTSHSPSSPGDYPRSLMRTVDKRGLVTYFWYDDSGNVVLKKHFGDLDGVSSTIEEAAYTFEYSALNLLTKSVDPAGNEKRFYYEDVDYPYLPTKVEHYAQGTLVSTNTYHYGEEEDLTSGEFANGLLKRDSKAVNSSDAAHTEWQHDSRGFVLERRQYVTVGTTTPVANATLDPTVTFIRNDRGEIVTEQVLNAAGGISIERHFEYDNMSRPIIKKVRDSSDTTLSTQRFYYNQNGELYWTDGPRTGVEDYTFRDYDGAGRVVSEASWRSESAPNGSGIRGADGQDSFEGQAIRSFDYDGFGNLERAYDARGNYVEHDYDDIGQLTETKSYAADGTLLSTVTFDQEPGGQLSYYQNPLTGITRKYYTDTGALRLEERPDGSTSEWRYNIDGRVAREYLRNGYYWQYTYDDPNRTITKQFHNPDDTPYLDADSRTHIEITEFDRRGNQVTTTSRVGLVTTTTFDGLNRPVSTSGSGGAIAPYTDEQSGSFSYSRDGLTVTQTNALGETTASIKDALGRTLSVEVRDIGSNLVRLSSFEYAADHNSVEVTQGDPTATGESLVRRTEFSNTFGQTVLVWKHTDEAAFDYELSVFDKAGNLVASEDALRQTTRYTYDGLNRMATSVLPDGAETRYLYDGASNLTQRIMPGGLIEERQFDAANRIEWTKLTKAAAITRHSTFTYKPIGDPNVGLPATETDQIRGDSKSFGSYDPLLRLTGMAAIGVTPVGEPTVYGYTKAYAYDPRGLVESSTLSYSDPELAASSIEVENLYDGYGQLYAEETLIDSVTHNEFNQYWDAAGRRDQLDTNLTPLSSYTFDWYADGHLKQVQTVETSPARQMDFDFTYDRSGLLASRTNPWRTTTIAARDQRGRELSRSVTAASVPGITSVMDETLQWRADSKLENYTVDRFGSDVWNESRDYIYNARGQLISESYAPAASEEAKVSYNFDEDKLGVLTRAETYGDAASSWAIPDGQLDGFARMQQEATYGTKTIPAHGLAEGARTVEIALYDGAVKRPLDASFSGEANDWKWEVDLELGAGEYELGIKANHPSGAYKSEEVRSAFTVTGAADQLIDITYDEAGYTQTRTFGDGRNETFYWDCAGRLLRIESRDISDHGYDFECVYDAYGRRLKAIQTPVLADGAQTIGIVTETCYYDPQVEFLSLMVAINGTRQWKVHGPDLNGSYGALQGIGGIEAVYQESNTQWHAALNDRFGNVLASIEEAGADDVLTWSDSRVGGYGALEGGTLKSFGTANNSQQTTNFVESVSWRSHRLDMTGYICMGDRYYDPVSARFLSPDPYGHGASMDLYSFAGGDPINFVDPTGRNVDDVLDAISYGVENNLVQAAVAGTLNFADDVSQAAGFGGIDPNNAFYVAAEGAGEGMQGLYDTGGLTAGFFLSEGQGELTLTGGFGPAASFTLARDEVGGDVSIVDTAWGAGAGVSAEFSLDVTDRSSDSSGFSQTVSVVLPAGNTSVGYTFTTSGNTDGSFSYSGSLEGGLSTQGVSPYLSLEAGADVNFRNGETQIVINPGAGVKTGVSGGAGGFFLIDWDFSFDANDAGDPVAGKNPAATKKE